MMKKELLKVLLVDDDEDDYFLTCDTLESIQSFEFETSWASSFEEAQTLIDENVYDLFIFDFFLGVNTGLTLAKEVISKRILTPIILLTGLGDKEIDKQASDIGVYDYLVKNDIDVTSLERSIRYTIRQAQIRKELKRSEMQYRSAIEHSNDIIFISDSNYLLKSLSNSVEAITNFERQDLIGTSLLDLIGAESVRHEFKEGLEKDRKIVNFPFMLKTNSKESKLSNISCSLHTDDFGNAFIYGTIIDKTDEQRAEKAKITNEKMEATARLMRTLAHEVRNPLSSIALATESIEMEETKENCEPYLGMIRRNTSRIDSIITKVLNSARVQSISLEKGSFTAVLKDAIDAVADRAALVGIEIVVEIGEKEHFMDLHREQLEIAFTNILVNALEAMNETDNPQLHITFSQRILRIEDNGVGISEEQQNHLFEPYFTTKKTGVGLGLASTLSILKVHGISIDVQSEIGEGTAFTLILPT